MREAVKTVFLDRDGVLNRRIVGDYVTCWSEFELLDGVLEAVVTLNRQGFRTVVVTNQRGVALGRMRLEDVADLHGRLSSLVAEYGGCLEEFYVCPHGRDEGCPCRKPKPGLLDQAHRFAPVDWPRSVLIGDSDSDILAGKCRQVTTIKLGATSLVGADFLAPDLATSIKRSVFVSKRDRAE